MRPKTALAEGGCLASSDQGSGALLQYIDVGRLIAAHVRAFQERRISSGQIGPELGLDHVALELGAANVSELALDDATLGIDSLALMDLVMDVAGFFNLQETGVEDYLFVQRDMASWTKLVAHHCHMMGPDLRLAFHTSGSTGKAKRVDHPVWQLCQEVDALSSELAGIFPRVARVISTVAPHHVYGFIWGTLLPRQLGVDVIDRFKASPQITARQSQAGDLVLATPFLWEKFAAYGLNFAPGCFGISSGGPMTDATRSAAQAVGLEGMMAVYGSTETGGIGTSAGGEDDYKLLSHLTRAGNTICHPSTGQPLDLQDRIEWLDDRQFRLNGRLDHVVQVAGTNVNVSEVENVLTTLDRVRSAAVRLDGHRLKAFIVPEEQSIEPPEAEIRKALLTLPAVARPEAITFGSALPRTETGKLADW